MNTDKIVKLASKLMIELIKTDLPNKEINRLNDIVADIREEAINYTRCSTQLKSVDVINFEEWKKRFVVKIFDDEFELRGDFINGKDLMMAYNKDIELRNSLIV